MERNELITLTKEQIQIAVDGIAFAHAFLALEEMEDNNHSEARGEAVKLIKRSLADSAVLAWCKILGSDGEDAHWKKLFECSNISSFTNLSQDDFSKRIYAPENLRKANNFSTFKDGTQLHNTITDYRRKALTHCAWDEDRKEITYPHIFPIQETLREFYEILYLLNLSLEANYCVPSRTNRKLESFLEKTATGIKEVFGKLN
ncbi:MAG: hypothetical protein K0R63_233 [Rickettsiales bacterium]|nr:hypothetical protein [Rickettsiales bacterium]